MTAALFAPLNHAAAAIPSYAQVGSFSLPTAASVFDIRSDGRILAVAETGYFLLESGVSTSSYTAIGSLQHGRVPTFGAGFVKISPDGSHIAVGDNGNGGEMWVVPTADLSTTGPTATQTIYVPNFDAAWTPNNTLYVNGAPFGLPPNLYRVDLSSSTASPVVAAIGDGSGGVAVRGNRLYTAIGYDAAGVLDGQVRSFDLPTLNGASAAVPFTSGLLETQASTGNSLAFDGAGNLIEAGFGGVAVIDLVTHQRIDLPGLGAFGFYTATYNAATQEILVRDYGATTVLRYGVPTPAGTLVLGLGGLLTARRRRP